MAEYDISTLDHAVSLGMALGERTTWLSGEHRSSITDQGVLAILTEEFGPIVAERAMTILRGGVRLVRIQGGGVSTYGDVIRWRETMKREAEREAAKEQADRDAGDPE
jgi:hypothetical protein